ncbi:hypothetical protein Droror1_Dr00002329 [Drosera rotundifolia]
METTSVSGKCFRCTSFLTTKEASGMIERVRQHISSGQSLKDFGLNQRPAQFSKPQNENKIGVNVPALQHLPLNSTNHGRFSSAKDRTLPLKKSCRSSATFNAQAYFSSPNLITIPSTGLTSYQISRPLIHE